MTSYLKIASGLTGTNYERLQKSSDKSRTKVLALSIAMMVPAMVWAVCSFLLAYVIMEASVVASLAIGAFFGTVILIIERLVVMGNGHWVVYVFRFLLAGVVAWLGSLLFDLVIFQKDIEQQLPSIRHEIAMKAQEQKKTEYDERNGIAQKTMALAQRDSIAGDYQQQAIAESSGLAGSGVKGAGSATKFKQLQADKALQQAQVAKDEMMVLQTASAAEQKAAYDTAFAQFDDKSLLFRMKAMNQLLTENSEMNTTYLLITAFLVFIELIVVIFKITWPKTAYEKEVDMIDELHQRRSDIVMGNAQAPHRLHPQVAEKSRHLSSGLNTFL